AQLRREGDLGPGEPRGLIAQDVARALLEDPELLRLLADALIKSREGAMHEAIVPAEAPKRGPRPGTGGRPRKGTEKREKRGISLDPMVARWIEEERLLNETFSEALERLLRRQMPERKN